METDRDDPLWSLATEDTRWKYIGHIYDSPCVCGKIVHGRFESLVLPLRLTWCTRCTGRWVLAHGASGEDPERKEAQTSVTDVGSTPEARSGRRNRRYVDQSGSFPKREVMNPT